VDLTLHSVQKGHFNHTLSQKDPNNFSFLTVPVYAISAGVRSPHERPNRHKESNLALLSKKQIGTTNKL
jgi:hypothetical protein